MATRGASERLRVTYSPGVRSMYAMTAFIARKASRRRSGVPGGNRSIRVWESGVMGPSKMKSRPSPARGPGSLTQGKPKPCAGELVQHLRHMRRDAVFFAPGPVGQFSNHNRLDDQQVIHRKRADPFACLDLGLAWWQRPKASSWFKHGVSPGYPMPESA